DCTARCETLKPFPVPPPCRGVKCEMKICVKMEGDAASPNILGESKAGYVLTNVAEVVERILTFVPTKNLLRIA
ncbi:hypothetical protein M9458_015421, partial [Cirrhinus mrigala]